MENKDVLIDEADDSTIVATTSDELGQQLIEQAIYDYQTKKNFYTSYYNDDERLYNKITPEYLDRLASNAQNNLKNIIEINQIIRLFINKDDLIGKVHEAIEDNINNNYELKYNDYNEKNKKIYDEVLSLIEQFNKQINLENLIIKSIGTTFDEGNYAMYLRKDINNDSFKVDYYPLGVAEVSDYECDGEPYLLININELTKRLKKMNKTNKNGKSLFFKNLDEEIKKNYPIEVYKAYKNKDKYAKLDIKNTGMMRINNMNRKYGLSPYFKSIKPSIRLNEIEEIDGNNLKARGKKIIHQVLRKELITDPKFEVTWSEGMLLASKMLLEAWNNNPVVYTSPPWVETVEYVEPKIEPTNINTINLYRSKIATALGISFLISEKGAFASAQISIDELMKSINKIAKQLEDILIKWYRGLLLDYGYDIKLCPEIKVINSELLKMELKIKLADTLFNKFGMSFKSTYEMLGRSYETEKLLRQKENIEQIDSEVFYPRQTGYTVSSKDNKNEAGRPSALNNDVETKDKDKVIYDKQRRDEMNVDN